jgi:membrane protease YdiL (CAAX protease family)
MADRICGRCGAALDFATVETGKQPLGERKARELWPALELWGILLCSYGLLGFWARFQDLSSPWIDVGVAVINILVVVIYCGRDRRRLDTSWSRSGLGGWGFPATLGAFAAIAGFDWIYFGGLDWLGVETLSFIESFRDHGWPVWTVFVLISIAPAVLEELAFRGQIMGRLEHAIGSNDALIVQAAMFSVLHMAPSIFVSHFVFGLIVGWLRRFTGSLYPGMIVHAAINAAVLGLELV